MALNSVKPDNFPVYGFAHAPCSKALLFVTGVSTVGSIFLPPRYKYLFDLRWTKILGNTEAWRLLTFQFFYDSTIDLVYGSIFLYYFRVLERRWGSRKYASFIFAVSSISISLHFALQYTRNIFPIPVSQRFTSGLYGPLFSLLVYYFRDIPAANIATQFPVSISSKVLLYVMILKLLASNSSSREAALVGLTSGILYRCNFLWVQKWLRVPIWLSNRVQRLFHALSGDNNALSQPVVMGATEEVQEDMVFDHLLRTQSIASQGMRMNRRRVGQGYSDVLQPSSTLFQDLLGNPDMPANDNRMQGEDTIVPEDKIRTLVEMGFAREAVVDALSNTNSDIQEATSILLSQ